MTYELYTTKHWMILPSFVHGILPTLMHNSNNHIALGVVEKKRPFLAVAGGSDYIRDAQVTEDGEVIPRYGSWGENLLAQMREPFVNVIPIDGPITRNGDACSYGSKEIRDWMMEAAGNKYCRAHALVINTPGGSAWAKNDFQQAIDFAHQQGQRVYGLIDGLCASAGMYLASFCDEVYVVNLKDQLGCVGVMASFFTLGDGEKFYTNETYHEYYATKSVNKNKEYRDIANDNDATLLIEELDKLEAEFRADMQRSFPAATDEHLDGKVFDADEVMGILCDGQMMLGDVVARAFAVADGSEEPIARTAGRNVGQPAEVTDDDNDDDDPTAAALAHAEAAAGRIAATMDNVSPKNSTTMTNEKYQKVAQVLGVEELTVTEEGTFLNAPLLDTLAEKLTEMQTKVAEAEGLQTKIDELTKQLDEQKNPAQESAAQEQAAAAGNDTEGAPAGEAAGTEAPASQEAQEAAAAEIDKITETLHTAEQKIAEKDKEIVQLKETLATLNGIAEERDQANATVAERDKAIETLTAEKDEQGKTIAEHVATITAKDAKIAEHTATIEKLNKQVKELQSEVKELSEKPAPMVDAGAGIPQDNGTGEGPKKQERITSEMSYEEIQEFEKRKREKK